MAALLLQVSVIGHDRLDLSLERDDFSSNRHPLYLFVEHDLRANASRCREGKPVPTFRIML